MWGKAGVSNHHWRWQWGCWKQSRLGTWVCSVVTWLLHFFSWITAPLMWINNSWIHFCMVCKNWSCWDKWRYWGRWEIGLSENKRCSVKPVGKGSSCVNWRFQNQIGLTPWFRPQTPTHPIPWCKIPGIWEHPLLQELRIKACCIDNYND